jgi:uncharacterized protein YcbK (DUF882 family)
MQRAYSIAFVILVVLFSAATGNAEPVRRYAMGNRQETSESHREASDSHQEASRSYMLQTVSVHAGCFPEKLRNILSHIAAQTHHEPIVTSGLRAHASRRGSLHRRCMAADIRVPGASYRAVIAAAASAPDIGGVGTYCNGIVHVDIGPKRFWNYCSRGRHFFRQGSPLIASADDSAGGLRSKLRRTIAKSTPPITKATTKYTTIAMSISKAKVPVLASSDEVEARSGSQR